MEGLKYKHVVVTGGARFIGSNVVEELMRLSVEVTMLDNLSTANYKNIESFIQNPLFTFVEGDICDYETCLNFGNYFSLNQVIDTIKVVLEDKQLRNSETKMVHGPDRNGDIRDSLADISETTRFLGYDNSVYFETSMKEYLDAII